MIPEIGQFAVILALCLALCQAILPMLGVWRQHGAAIRVARPAAIGQCLFVSISFLCLVYSFAVNDFSVLYVAENSNSHLPLIYRLCAVWGAHEGSLLLWIEILALWTLAVCLCSRSLTRDMRALVISVMGWISVGFLLFLLLTSNPFTRLLPSVPVNGQDLNPLLQDPGFIAHPPMLYMGYVGFAVAFAFAIAGLLLGKIDQTWVRWTRPWTLIAWAFLTVGIVLGSWWSYRELGWGGWWFWDPVENASFMPWLIGGALVHSLAVTEKRGSFKSWTVLLAIFAFSLSLLGTFLVRSGILISVHAFAVDPARGAFMLKFLGIVVCCSLIIYAWRGQRIHDRSEFKLYSRESFLLVNNVLLTVAAVTVMIGTLYPLVLQALDLGKISVGPPYFNSVFVPIMLLLMLFMGLGPHSQWRDTVMNKIVKRLTPALVIALLTGFLLPWLIMGQFSFGVSLGVGFAVWVILAMLIDTVRRAALRAPGLSGFRQLPLSHFGMLLGHLGLAATALGIVLVSSYSVTKTVSMVPGDSTTIGAYQFHFRDIRNLQGPNYTGATAQVIVSKKGSDFRQVLNAEKRFYPVRDMALSKVALAINPWRDLYVALGSPIATQQHAWSFRLYYKPFVRWIWGGGFLIILGSLLAVFDKRYRRRQETTVAKSELLQLVEEH